MHIANLAATPFGTARRMLGVLTTVILTATAMIAHAGPSAVSPADLSQYRNHNRLLFIFAPSAADSRYVQQKARFEGKESGLTERDLIRFDVFAAGNSKRGDEALSAAEGTALRKRFEVAKGQFKVFVLGKDGRIAYSSTRPVTAPLIFGLIDGMPMRQDEIGARQKSMAKAGSPPRPDKKYTPDQVVRFQMEGLQHNDVPKPDSGIATTFAFASPQNKEVTGPLEHFAEIVKAPAYLPMLNCKSVTYDPVVINGDQAQQRVHIVAADGTRITYLFLLSRQTDGPFEGCWMNDGCVRDESDAANRRDLT